MPMIGTYGAVESSQLSSVDGACNSAQINGDPFRSQRSPAPISPTFRRVLRILGSCCVIALTIHVVDARILLQNVISAAALSAAIATTPIASENVNFAGSYADPNHPNCLREIQVIDPPNAKITGTDGDPGCPPDGSGTEWSLIGTIKDDTILIDFSPKGGPKDLKGVWEPSPVAGIRFPDGNLWSKKAIVQ